MTLPTHSDATGMPRRAFLVRSAVVSAGAVLSSAAVAEAGSPGTWPAPQLAKLIPVEPVVSGTTSLRCVKAAARGVAFSPIACRLRVMPLSMPLRSIEAAADLDVYYPTPALWSTAWTVAPAAIVPVTGEPHTLAAGVESLAPAASGAVRLRVPRRSIEGTALDAVEFTLPSRPDSYLLAIPLSRSARLPAWRRCEAGEPEPLSLHDPWRDKSAAPGCVVVRLDLIPTDPTPTDPTNHSSEGAD